MSQEGSTYFSASDLFGSAQLQETAEIQFKLHTNTITVLINWLLPSLTQMLIPQLLRRLNKW